MDPWDPNIEENSGNPKGHVPNILGRVCLQTTKSLRDRQRPLKAEEIQALQQNMKCKDTRSLAGSYSKIWTILWGKLKKVATRTGLEGAQSLKTRKSKVLN